jgi:RNA polymerase sigma-70 factor (ECF subfamily)
MEQPARGALDAAWREHSRRVLATLIRLLGGFEAAEEGLNEAFLAAARAWPSQGAPANPYAWLVSAGRNHMIDRWRREGRATILPPGLLAEAVEAIEPQDIHDDELRLLFICCHPDLSPDGRVSLTLREVGGLSTEEIARAYLAPPPTIAQRIVRAKAKIRDLALPYEVPGRREWPERIGSVLQVIYLVFNEGYSATHNEDLVRGELCRDAIRLGRLVVTLTDDAEALGLLALMLLHDARRAARIDAAGDFVALEDQDRTLWDPAAIQEARALIARALAGGTVGPYLVQAAIADLHVAAPDAGATDWAQIVGLYDTLMRIAPSPVAALNRAVAIGRRDGDGAGLAAIEAVLRQGDLARYHLAYAALADVQARLGHVEAAVSSYETALTLTDQPTEQRLLTRRLQSLSMKD